MKDRYEKRLDNLQKRNKYLEEKYKLQAEQNEYKTKAKAPSTSKLILWTVVLICVEIVIFSEVAMLKTGDTSALYALIGVPVTLVPSVLGYYHKAGRENCVGGVVYETAVNGSGDLEGSSFEEVNINDGN